MAIATLDALIAGLGAGQNIPFWKSSLTAGANTFHSVWTAAGLPEAGAPAGSASGAACTSATVGAMAISNAGTGLSQYLASLAASGAGSYQLIVYDRLVHTSALSGVVTTAQTVGSAALTRYTNGEWVEPWVELYAATGATASNVTISYTNQAGTAGRTSTSVAFPTSPAVGRLLPLPLEAGDFGVRSAESLTLSASTGAAGDFGITLMRRLAAFQIGLPATADWASLGLPEIVNDACLALAFFTTGTSTGATIGGLQTAVG